jgi:hypothetical protein
MSEISNAGTYVFAPFALANADVTCYNDQRPETRDQRPETRDPYNL